MKQTKSNNVLKEAIAIVYDRSSEKAKEYGPFDESMTSAAIIASELTGKNITTEDFYKCLMALKLARLKYSSKDDTFLDFIAYSAALHKSIKDKEIKQLWDDFRQLNCVYKGKNKEFFCKQIPAKKRYIDVYVENKGRISKINKEMAQEIQMFLVTDLSEYLWGKCE